MPVHHRYALAWLFCNIFKVKFLHSMPLTRINNKLDNTLHSVWQYRQSTDIKTKPSICSFSICNIWIPVYIPKLQLNHWQCFSEIKRALFQHKAAYVFLHLFNKNLNSLILSSWNFTLNRYICTRLGIYNAHQKCDMGRVKLVIFAKYLRYLDFRWKDNMGQRL